MRGAFKRQATFCFWNNPDGSLGGEVSVAAEVHPTATIERHAVVLAGARIGPGEVVPAGHIVEADGTMISFGRSDKPATYAP